MLRSRAISPISSGMRSNSTSAGVGGGDATLRGRRQAARRSLLVYRRIAQTTPEMEPFGLIVGKPSQVPSSQC